MGSINLNQLTLHGELAMRANLNFTRLETEKYWPETIFEMDQNAWPADWEGRTMLALTMLAQATQRTPAFLDEILERLAERLNAKGYIGPVYEDGVTHEQAMAGHSWMLRALGEYYNWKKDSEPEQAEKALAVLKSIVKGLYLPQTENYRNYPVDESSRYDNPAWILSHKQSKTKTHAGTSDCGCAFIAIDGATAAYELLGTPELKELIEAMIDSYETLPREALHVQTHATLSGIRGILRYHRISGEARYLNLAVEIFDLYKTKAWTDHYANYNWFGLPRWTEPCAVIDSFIISQELWEATGEEGCLQDAHHILYNAVAHAQRVNGAFGTDLCVGAEIGVAKTEGTEGWSESEEAVVFAKALTYEVFWCCNMRGGDGLSRAAVYSFYTDGNRVTIPYFNDCKVELKLAEGTLVLREKANYPFDGRVSFRVEKNTAGTVQFRCFAPERWTDGEAAEVTLNGRVVDTDYEAGFICFSEQLNTGDTLVLHLEIKFYVSKGNECMNNSKDHFSFRHGPLMLGVHSILEHVEAVGEEAAVSRHAEMLLIGGGRYETKTMDGRSMVLQPMWGKENMIRPLDIYQVLFKDTAE